MTWLELVTIAAIALWNIVTYWFVMVASLPCSNYWQAMKVNQTSTAIANTLPGGGALGIGVTYGMYMSYGFTPTEISLSAAISGIWNNFAKLGMPVIPLVALDSRRRKHQSAPRRVGRSGTNTNGRGDHSVLAVAAQRGQSARHREPPEQRGGVDHEDSAEACSQSMGRFIRPLSHRRNRPLEAALASAHSRHGNQSRLSLSHPTVDAAARRGLARRGRMDPSPSRVLFRAPGLGTPNNAGRTRRRRAGSHRCSGYCRRQSRSGGGVCARLLRPHLPRADPLWRNHLPVVATTFRGATARVEEAHDARAAAGETTLHESTR